MLHTAFRASLATTYSTRTVAKHAGAVKLCIHVLCAYTDMEQLEAGMRGMVNSPFRRWQRSTVLERTDADELLRVAPRTCFHFLDHEKGVHYPAVLKAVR